MKKKTSSQTSRAASPNPSTASLREMPEIDPTRYRVRRNPYAARIAREGIHIVHDGPSKESLAEIPEVDYATVRVRPNPYASRGAKPSQHGRGRSKRDEVAIEPSKESLEEMPEIDFSKYRVRRNPYVTRAGETALQYGRGRPRRGEEVGETKVRSLRLPESLWKAIDAEAKSRKTTPHALIRELVVNFVETLR